MNILHTVVSFLIAIAILVVIHELGHYTVARWCGVKALRFSLGMGKVIWMRRFGADQTEWAISLLPLGGYVKMLDAREQDMSTVSEADLKREFTRQSVYKRMAIVVAGPLANFLLAILLFAATFMIGTPEPTARIGATPQGSVAQVAGLRDGDLILSVGNDEVKTWEDMRWRILNAAIDHRNQLIRYQRKTLRGIEDGVTSLSFDSLDPDKLNGDFMTGLGLTISLPPAVIEAVMPDGAAHRAGLQPGDRVVSVDAAAISNVLEFVSKVSASPDKVLMLGIIRAKQRMDVEVLPEKVMVSSKPIGQLKVRLAGAGPEIIVFRTDPFDALIRGVRKTWDASVLNIKMIVKMVAGKVSIKNVTGPLTIADYAGRTASLGVVVFMGFLAFISVGLAVMNLLPIPVLDGGLLLYYALEAVSGKPVSERANVVAQKAGLGLLMALMAVAFFNDITRLMS